MHISYLSASVVPSRSANSVHVMKMCAAFARTGHEVTLYARKGSEGDPYEHYGASGFRMQLCRNLQIPAVGAAAYTADVWRHLQRRKTDLVYARHLYSLVAVSSVDAPLVFEAHTPPATWLQRRLECALFSRRNFQRLVVISRALADWYLEHVPLLKQKSVVVAHDAADEVPFAAAAPLDAPGRRFSVGYVGHLYPGKGMELISQLPERLPDVDFHVIGGTEQDLAYWRARTNAKNLHLHGYMPPRVLPEKMKVLMSSWRPISRRWQCSASNATSPHG
jgi:glycosyltransferase involved in cell wall biosynthesis